jgi:glycosyltransferase involved in cell wall biosynthesis
MSKTILIITDNVPDQINGVVTTFRNLEDHARRDGYSVVYCHPRQFPNFACPGYPEVRLCWPHGISTKIKAIRPDFIHIATEGPVGLFARWWCERNDIPYNTSYHTDFPEFLKTMYHVPKFITYWYLRWFHKNSHRVLVTTKTIEADLKSHGFERMVIWTRGVRRDLTPSIDRTDHDSPMILNVGRVSAEKGLAELATLQHDYTLVIVGDGPYMPEARRILPAAKFVGYKQGQELIDYYNQADVFVFPSRADTFGLVMIEAMAQGTPVAAFPVQGPVDVIEQDINGYMHTDLKTAVEKCLKLSRNQVKQSSNHWTWQECWRIFKDNLAIIKQ